MTLFGFCFISFSFFQSLKACSSFQYYEWF